MSADVIATAQQIADEVLFTRAMATDVADVVPVENLDALAEAGFYGLFAPAELGGLGAEFPQMTASVEILAGGCLSTAFIWIQHFATLGSLLGDASHHLRDAWLRPVVRGERRCGIALSGFLPGPPTLTTEQVDGGWALSGRSPFVTGWGRIDAVYVAARGPNDTVVTLLVDAVEQPRLRTRRQHLVGANASATVEITYDGVVVPEERLLQIVPYDPDNWLKDPRLRLNGSLSLGVAARCCRLIGPSRLDDQLAARRDQMDRASPEDMPVARAAASQFAVRAAAALMVHVGSGSVLIDQHAQRLAREALFLLIFGSRPSIRSALLESLFTSGP